jgi:hypothetical protein
MATHGLQYRQRIGVGKQDLESMAGHDDEVEAPVRLIGLRRGLDPFNLFRLTFASGHSQHRRCWINTRHPVAAFGEGTAERARTAAQVEDTTWARSGEGEVEVGILRPRVREVVNLCDLRVVVVHTLSRAAKASPSRFYSGGAVEAVDKLRATATATTQSMGCAIGSAHREAKVRCVLPSTFLIGNQEVQSLLGFQDDDSGQVF